MTTKKAELIDNITERLSIFFYSIECNNTINRLQQNIDSEDLMCGLLNLINDWSLINLNGEEQNFAGIDLGDYQNRVCVQVTSDKSREKVESTIKTFENKCYDKKFDRLIFAYLKMQKTKFAKGFSTKKLSFDASKDTFDLKDLVNAISKLEEEKIEKIYDYLKKEIVLKSLSLEDDETIIKMQPKIDTIKKKCIAKLKSLGLDDLIAWSILADTMNNIDLTVDDDTKGLRFLVGGFGSGKSHQLYCLFMKLLESYDKDNSTYFPLFYEAKEFSCRKDLMSIVDRLDLNIDKKVCLIIDGLDETTMAMAQIIVDELELLSNSNEFVKIIVSSRPLTIINDKLQIKPHQLSIKEINKLYCLINDDLHNNIEYLLGKNKKALLQTLSKPFCAVLYSLYRKNNYLYNEMDFIKIFISKSVNKVIIKYPECEEDIKKLAIRAIDFNFGNIDKSEVRSIAKMNELLLTGLFIEEERGISFTLPITAQWFAAEALREGVVSIEEILNNESRLIKWTYPLAFLFNQMTFDESKQLFGKIVDKAPGFASIIVRAGVDLNSGIVNENKVFNGENLYYALSIWLKVFNFTHLPYYENGKLNTIYFNQKGNQITYAISKFYTGKDVEIKDVSLKSSRGDVYFIKCCRVVSQPTWPWIEALDYIQNGILKKLLKDRTFIVNDSILEDEYIWSTCLDFIHANGLVYDSINIELIDEKLEKIPRCDEIITGSRRYINYSRFLSEVKKYKKKGNNRIECPYVRGSLPLGPFIWSQYKDDEMKAFIEKVFVDSLNSYKVLVEKFFPILKEQMGIYKLLPAKMEGYFEFRNRQSITGGPCIMWTLVPSKNGENCVELKNGTTSNLSEFFKDTISKVKNVDLENPYMEYSVHSECFKMGSETPVTDIIYDWLEQDLRRVGIVEK